MTSYVIIGASRGLGLGWVRLLASDPKDTVFATIRNKATAIGLEAFVNSKENKHKNVTVLEATLDDYKSLKAAAEQVSKATGGKIDILICNGAMMHHERNGLTLDGFPDEETLEKDLLAFFKTNVVGTTHTINAFLPLLRAGKTKKVLVVSSTMGSPRFALETNYDNVTGYAISKAALNMVVAKYAAKFRNEGFVFLSVSPGLVKTIQGPPEDIKKYEDHIAERRKINPNIPSPISVEKSVTDQLALLQRVTPADSGAFLHANGLDANGLGY